MNNVEKLYKKIAVYPQKVFGENLSEIILTNALFKPIDELPAGQTHTYELHILVTLPPKEAEKYTTEIADYYKKKCQNTRFKLDAKVFNEFHYKHRRHFIKPLPDIVVYSKNPHVTRFVRPNYPPGINVKKSI